MVIPRCRGVLGQHAAHAFSIPGLHGGKGKEERKAHQRPQGIGTDPHVGLATHLVRGLVKDGVVIINVHNFQVDRDLSCAGWGPIV